MSSTHRIGWLNVWPYSDNRALLWFSRKESDYPHTHRHLKYERGRAGSLGFMLYVGGEDHEIMLRLDILLTTIYLSVNQLVKSDPEKLKAAAEFHKVYEYEVDYADQGRLTGCSIEFSRDMGNIELALWKNDYCWSRDSKKFARWPYCEGWSTRFWFDNMLGGRVYEKLEDTVSEYPVLVTMPEGPYEAEVKQYQVQLGYKFWKYVKWRTEINIESGIPIPGKGENSWDCGIDARFGTTYGIEDEPLLPAVYAERMRIDVQETRDNRGWDASMVEEWEKSKSAVKPDGGEAKETNEYLGEKT